MNSFLKLAWLYDKKVIPKISHLRGATRISQILESLALSKLTREDGFSIEVNGETVEFRCLDDMEYLVDEYKVVERFVECLNSAERFCDVGGYHGFYSVIASSRCDISCFEMDPACADIIRENLELNGSNWEVIEAPVWSGRKTLDFQASGSGQDSVGSGHESKQAITLDQYYRDRPKPDIVKVDVEGAEMRVLRGGEKVLRDTKPQLFIEIHRGKRIEDFGSSEIKLAEFLENLGYEITTLMERGEEKFIHAETRSNT